MSASAKKSNASSMVYASESGGPTESPSTRQCKIRVNLTSRPWFEKPDHLTNQPPSAKLSAIHRHV
jgi:hypothetical protein